MLRDMKELIKFRKDNKITQQELGVVCGLHTGAVSRIEGGADSKLSTLILLNEGVELLAAYKFRKLTGVIVLDKTSFESTLWKAMVQELEGLERDGRYKGNGHHLTQRLVDMISKAVRRVEDGS